MANKADIPVESSLGTADVAPNEGQGPSAPTTDKTAVGADSQPKSRVAKYNKYNKYNQLLRIEEELGDSATAKTRAPTK
ncbi:hypothetical protein [Pseudomonas sp. MPB26]|uniref:hypothetical protein n=1 Tax=Pseudomonas sp. MPB26 TaxID=3388491 RepID=UPI003985178C